MNQRFKQSIAVLPFVNMSSNIENEYFSDGMTEEIINALAKINDLKVTSRTSSFYFKGKNIPIAEIGQQLQVAIILEGSVRLAGNMMRITAQLIDVKEDFHFWSETFDRSMENIFAVQDEISLLIADKIREHIGHFEINDRLVEEQNISSSDYQQYLKGQYHVLKMTKHDIDTGIAIFKELIACTPDYPYPYLGIHVAYTLLGSIGLAPSSDCFIKAQPYLQKAIELAPNLAECQLHLSWIAFLQEWDMDKAYQHIRQSIAAKPSPEAYQTMTSVLVAEAKYVAALNYIDTAIQIDPLSGINQHLKGYIYYCQEHYELAIVHFKKSLELNPNASVSVLYLGQALLMLNKTTEALDFFSQITTDKGGDLQKIGGKTLSYAVMGAIKKADLGMQQLQTALETDLMERALHLLILCNVLLGRKETALQLVEQGFELRLPLLVYLKVEPCLKALHTEPKFQELMQQIFGQEASATLPPTPKKYQKPSLSQEETKALYQQLETLMQTQQPFLQANLSLRQLAKMLDLHPNKLSELLNETVGKNFSAYINKYRVETFKQLAKKPENKHLSLLGIAYESGFNSKTTFNTFFKKETGSTPKEYLKGLNL